MEVYLRVIYNFIDFANRAEKTLGDNDKIADVSELVNTKDRIWKSNMIYVLARNVFGCQYHPWTDEPVACWRDIVSL